VNYLLGLALDLDPPDLCFLSSWDYRGVSPYPVRNGLLRQIAIPPENHTETPRPTPGARSMPYSFHEYCIREMTKCRRGQQLSGRQGEEGLGSGGRWVWQCQYPGCEVVLQFYKMLTTQQNWAKGTGSHCVARLVLFYFLVLCVCALPLSYTPPALCDIF
jgi:hypothetical protein